jgi:hypothetical protein
MEDVRMNEEVMEVVEDFVAPNSFSKGLKICVGAAVVSGVGFVTYKYAVKPLVSKMKDKKEAKKEAKVVQLHPVVEEDEIQE